jgi:hypothetical protein
VPALRSTHDVVAGRNAADVGGVVRLRETRVIVRIHARRITLDAIHG